jgi:hypothetical protein
MEFIFIHNNTVICGMVYKSYEDMKATNKFWEKYVIEGGMKIPKIYRVEPKDHDKFKWISQDGRIFKLKELDDIHLANIYKMLTKSLAYHEDLDESMSMFGEPNGEMAMDAYLSGIRELSDRIYTLEKYLHHIAFEVHKRNIFINYFNKSEKCG